MEYERHFCTIEEEFTKFKAIVPATIDCLVEKLDRGLTENAEVS